MPFKPAVRREPVGRQCTVMATMNVGRGAIAKGAATLAAFHTSGLDVDVAALQEVDIDTVSADAFVQDWKSRGFYATLSPFVQGIARAAVISRVPCRSVSFPRAHCP